MVNHKKGGQHDYKKNLDKICFDQNKIRLYYSIFIGSA